MIKRILVGVAGTASTAAKIAMTVDIARRHGATVSLMSVIDRERAARVGPVPVGAGHYAQSMREERLQTIFVNAEAAVERFVDACREADIGYTVLREEGDPIDLLAAAWRTHDLCVLGLRGWFSAGVMPEPENALLRLLRLGVRPILAVAEEEIQTVKRVLIAYDGSPEAAKAMKRCVQMHLWGDVAVHLTAFDRPDKEARRALDEAAGYIQAHGLAVDTSTSDQAMVDGIGAEAERVGAEVKVIGIRYRLSILGERFDSRAAAVARRSARPVFMTH